MGLMIEKCTLNCEVPPIHTVDRKQKSINTVDSKQKSINTVDSKQKSINNVDSKQKSIDNVDSNLKSTETLESDQKPKRTVDSEHIFKETVDSKEMSSEPDNIHEAFERKQKSTETSENDKTSSKIYSESKGKSTNYLDSDTQISLGESDSTSRVDNEIILRSDKVLDISESTRTRKSKGTQLSIITRSKDLISETETRHNSIDKMSRIRSEGKTSQQSTSNKQSKLQNDKFTSDPNKADQAPNVTEAGIIGSDEITVTTYVTPAVSATETIVVTESEEVENGLTTHILSSTTDVVESEISGKITTLSPFGTGSVTTEKIVPEDNEVKDIPIKVSDVPVIRIRYRRPKLCKPEAKPCCIDGDINLNLGTIGRRRGWTKGNLDGVHVHTLQKSRSWKVKCSLMALLDVSFEAIDDYGCFGCLAGPYCGRRMLKVELELSPSIRKNTLFYIGKDRLSTEIHGKYPNIMLYTNDNNDNKTAILKMAGAIGPRSNTLTIFISNQHVRVVSDSGLDHSQCIADLFQLNSQFDPSYTDVSSNAIIIGINHAPPDEEDAVGFGICNARLSWECPWQY